MSGSDVIVKQSHNVLPEGLGHKQKVSVGFWWVMKFTPICKPIS